MFPEAIQRRWNGGTCVVAATGPSLTPEVAEQCRGYRCLAVSNAYTLLPWAEAMYSADSKWWNANNGALDFKGERWSSQGLNGSDDKQHVAGKYGLRLVAGENLPGFSFDQSKIHYGNNSGFQGVNLALLFGATRIILVGFNMQNIQGRKHFFGDHPKGLHSGDPIKFVSHFDKAAKLLPNHVQIINCTANSAIRCFPIADLQGALDGVEFRAKSQAAE